MMDNPSNKARPFGGWRELMQIAWPLIINAASFAALNFFDRLFLSWYSEDAFRAALPSGILFFTMVCGFMALAGFANTFVAQYWGANDKAGCAKATAQGVFLAIASFPLIMLLRPLGVWLLKVSDHGPEIFALESTYFQILMWCGGGMVLSAALSSFFSGRGKTAVVMGCNIGANLLNIALNYALIFGKWGFPEMGIQGAGWASVAGAWISPVIFAWIYFSKPNRTEFNTLHSFRIDPSLLRRMLRFGIPAGIQWFLDVAAFTAFVMLVGRLGAVAHVASNIALSINLIAFMPMTGMGIAASILVGQYLGRNQPQYAERIGWLTLRIGLGYVLCIGASFLLFPRFYIGLFESHADGAIPFEELYHAVRILLMMLAVWGLADATSIILSGALKGAGDTRFVLIFQSILAWGFLVFGQSMIVLVLHKGLYVSWLWTVAYILLLATGFTLRFRSDRWKAIDLLDRKPKENILETEIPID